MADFVKGMFGGSQGAAPAGDSDFADFAAAPPPAAATGAAKPTGNYGAGFMLGGAADAATLAGRPYTKWYRVWERTTPQDFMQEAMIAPFIVAILVLHWWGRRANRRVARNWAAAHAGTLSEEFAVVGFDEPEARQAGLADELQGAPAIDPEQVLREKAAHEFHGYATGRQNVAFLDVKLVLLKRHNPLQLAIEWMAGQVFPSMLPGSEHVEATACPFDGHERDIVPVTSQAEQDALEAASRTHASAYDGFVWAVVHKDEMRRLRDERYDLSLTTTKDNARLPPWATVMSESAEITDALLTPDLVAAITATGDAEFRSLILSDQPVDKPTTLQEAAPHKRINLSLNIPARASSSPAAYDASKRLFALFLRLPDALVGSARFRPEVMRKIRATRETEIEKIRRRDDEEKAEERKFEADKKKKAERDAKLKGLSADEQRKFLDKEREKDQRKQQKKMTKRG